MEMEFQFFLKGLWVSYLFVECVKTIIEWLSHFFPSLPFGEKISRGKNVLLPQKSYEGKSHIVFN